MMQVEMINYRPTEQTVYVQMDYEYVPGKAGGDATGGAISATGCSGIGVDWKPAKNTSGSVASDGYQVLMDGHIINLRRVFLGSYHCN